METLLLYQINASAGIVLFFLVYWLVLRKETFHKTIRWFLLGSLLLAILLPLFPIHYEVLAESQPDKMAAKTISDTFKHIPVFVDGEETSTAFSWQQVILIVYITGVVMFLLRLLTQTVVLIHLMVKYRNKSFNGIRIVENEKYGLPFSFFNIVFINPKFHTQENLPEILAHEKVHIRENHWFDLLIIELLTVIFWFNPFIWFFERAIKQNHEYLADKGVIAQGHNAGRYQALLVNQLMGMQIIGITNNLNFALNTNRLKMMTKKKTPRISGVKFAWALPAVALLLFAFAEPQYLYEKPELIGNIISDTQTPSDKQLTIHGKVVLKETGEALPGANILIKGTAIGTVSDLDGTFTLIDPNPNTKSDGSLNSTVVVSFVGLKTLENNLSVSGTDGNKAKFTFKMEDEVILIDTQVPPPPPPPPGKVKAEKLVKNSDENAPPPPPKVTKEKLINPAKSGAKSSEFWIVEEMPQYPGGQLALAMHIQKMQKKLAIDKNIKGKAKVVFTVNSKGKITDIKIVEKDNDLAAKGAYAIASGMEDWSPGKQRGKPVSVKYLLPIEFK